jgi:hypothetical protein
VTADKGGTPFGVIKFCPSAVGYQPLPFALSDQIDYSKNNNATILYWRPSTKVSAVEFSPCETLFYENSAHTWGKYKFCTKKLNRLVLISP